MRFISRSAFLALAAVCALGVVGLASASAASPEFGTSKYMPAKFSGAATDTIHFQEVGGSYSCNGVSSISGTIASSTSLTGVVVKFKCESGSSIICQRPLKELETRELKGRLGYVTKPTKVGLLLEPATEPIANCTAFDGVPAEIKGSLLEFGYEGTLTFTTEHYMELKA